MDAPAPVLLRPLGVGEIIDRALTLYLRNFVPMTTTVLVVIFVPLAISQYFLLSAQSGEFQAFSTILRHAGATGTRPVLPAYSFSYPDLAVGYLMLLLYIPLAIIANNAVAVNVAEIYRGRRPTAGTGLRVAFAHWVRLLGLTLMGFLIGIGVYAILVIVVLGTAFGAIAASTALPGLRSPLFIAVLVFAALVAVLAVIVIACLFVLAFAFAGYAIVIEQKGVLAAIGSGFERIFNRREWGKATLIVIVAGLIAFGISMLASVAQMMLLFVPGIQVVVALWSTFFAVISTVVQTVFYAVYYYDVRIRREGLDLEVALGRLPAAGA